ncbi:MAG TPA: alpha/beta hydrolase [Microvirga sp.]|jgi:sigma-B regulation protein RsbQ|nr:alpha/beta hydrolase [Microvirga sp.]
MVSVLQRNNVKIMGQGRQPMLFAHGYGCDQNMWRFITPAFADSYRIVLFDHVGHGRSDPSTFDRARYGTLQGYAEDVLAICRELDLEDVIFVGHSVSAMIGVLAALQEPRRFSRLVLIGPSPCYINVDDYVGGFKREDIEGLLDFLDSNHLGWSSTMAPVIMGNADRPELGEELANSFCRTDPEIAKHFARVTFLSDNRSDLPKLAVPALILQCSQDAIAPEQVGRFVHESLPGSRFVQMRATGHCPNLSAPEETIHAIQDFLHDPVPTKYAA